jgi:hypothetical protein
MGFGMEILFAPHPPGDRPVNDDELREIAGAGLDVYEDEPRLAPGLADLSNSVLLPHVGNATVPVRREMSRLSTLNAIAMAERRMPPHAVNPEAMGERPPRLPDLTARGPRRHFDGGARSRPHTAVR